MSRSEEGVSDEVDVEEMMLSEDAFEGAASATKR